MRKRPFPSAIAFALSALPGVVLALADCDHSEPPSPAPDAAGSTLTFWQDVAPVLQQRCVSCHRDGGVAPFRLDVYAVAKPRAAAIASAVASRTMPPWLATGDGSCGEFEGSKWLSQAEIATITRWAGAGAQEGTPRIDLVPPAHTSLGDEVTVVTPEYRPQPRGDALAHADDYRCFPVDAKLGSPQFLTGFEVVPGNPALIHHVLLMQVDPRQLVRDGRSNAAVMQALDDQSPEAGWPCYGLAGEEVEVQGVPVTWAPGMGVASFPANTGVMIAPESQLVMQVHYNLERPELRGRPDVTKVRLKVAATVERPGFFDLQDAFLDTAFSKTPASLAPGQKLVEYTWETNPDDVLKSLGTPYLDVYGIFPHMHATGRTQRIEIIKPAGAKTCAVDVRAWNFDWQLYYFYKQPLRIEPGDKVRVTCGFDTSARSQPTLPGWGTSNDMCFMGLFLVPPRP